MSFLKNIFNSSAVAVLDREPLFAKKQQPKINIVQEIHDTFYNSMDSILEACNITKPTEDINKDLHQKIQDLVKLGFTGSIEVENLQKIIKNNNKIIDDNNKLALKKQNLEILQKEYPFYKFIDQDTLDKICNKYGLMYAHVSFFKSEIPSKNVKEILNFKIKEDNLIYIDKEKGIENLLFTSKKEYIGRNYSILPNESKSMIIAAPATDFNLDKFEYSNKSKYGKLKAKVDKDPIVLQPISVGKLDYWNTNLFYAVVTAWGDEASDSEIVNIKMN